MTRNSNVKYQSCNFHYSNVIIVTSLIIKYMYFKKSQTPKSMSRGENVGIHGEVFPLDIFM